MAETFPQSTITAFSNSHRQRQHIEDICETKGLRNVQVKTGDVVEYEFAENAFDRVVSIELFEHMKNYALLMDKITRTLRPGGKLFVHIFAHADTAYDFDGGWMSTYFFTGGTMPSADLLHFFQGPLVLKRQWWVSGRHYAQTSEVGAILQDIDADTQDWLTRLNKSKAPIWPHLEKTYGPEMASVWYYRWQIFYMACAELFAFGQGNVWGVSHYLFEKPS